MSRVDRAKFNRELFSDLKVVQFYITLDEYRTVSMLIGRLRKKVQDRIRAEWKERQEELRRRKELYYDRQSHNH